MSINKQYQTLRLILGDQLNASHTWYKEKDDSTLYVIAELKQETDYVRHHIQKVCAFFSAMANFANALSQAEHHVLYLTLDDTQGYADLPALLNSLCEQYGICHFEFQRPDEYRLYEQLHTLKLPSAITIREYDSEHFLLPYSELMEQFPQGTHILMEHFYRRMRKRFDILMSDGKPVGGKWNFDKQNRNKLKPDDIAVIPAPLVFSNPIRDIRGRLERHQVKTIGTTNDDLLWPVTCGQAIEQLAWFCRYGLPRFGQFQDAMTGKSDHQWSLYHSRLSFALNSKILHPMQVIQAALNAWHDSDGEIDIAQVEGFIRQILGWREYIRGVYWGNMPYYQQQNELGANRPLPELFWTGETKMACMKAAINQSLNYAYAHHIQRLMVTGNFCLLTGIDPNEVDRWYLGIYIDAIEWVEMPNVRGMTQFADGGIVATKPYAASGNYINKMSDYCAGCHYNVKLKTEDNACPLNSLYWHFLHTHEKRLTRNPRVGMIYRSWDQLTDEQQQKVLNRARYCLDNLDEL